MKDLKYQPKPEGFPHISNKFYCNCAYDSDLVEYIFPHLKNIIPELPIDREQLLLILATVRDYSHIQSTHYLAHLCADVIKQGVENG